MNAKSRIQCDIKATLDRCDILALSQGATVVHSHRHLDLCVTGPKESPLEYLERTWAEPRFGETPQQHFNRIHGDRQ